MLQVLGEKLLTLGQVLAERTLGAHRILVGSGGTPRRDAHLLVLQAEGVNPLKRLALALDCFWGGLPRPNRLDLDNRSGDALTHTLFISQVYRVRFLLSSRLGLILWSCHRLNFDRRWPFEALDLSVNDLLRE